jgi:hypothetical protein
MWTVIIFAVTLSLSMYCLAYQLIYNRNGKVATCFRISLSTTSCTMLVLSHLYHGRWGLIPDVVIATDDDDEPPYSEAELSRMKPRPNLERVIEEEHQKSLRLAQINTSSTPNTKNHFPTRSRSRDIV